METRRKGRSAIKGMLTHQHLVCFLGTAAAVLNPSCRHWQLQQGARTAVAARNMRTQCLPEGSWGIETSIVNNCLVGVWQAIHISLDGSKLHRIEQLL